MEAFWRWLEWREEEKLLSSIFSSSLPRILLRGRLVASVGEPAAPAEHRVIGSLAKFVLTLLAVTGSVSLMRQSLSKEQLEVQGEAHEKAIVAERYHTRLNQSRRIGARPKWPISA